MSVVMPAALERSGHTPRTLPKSCMASFPIVCSRDSAKCRPTLANLADFGRMWAQLGTNSNKWGRFGNCLANVGQVSELGVSSTKPR